MAEQKQAHGEIDWSAAEVADGKLKVAVEGEVSKEWAARVEEIVERLQPSGGWTVNATAGAIEVEPVEPGSEPDVRHFVEGAVQQANADFAPEEEDDADEPSDADASMTEEFRSFSPPPEQ